MGPTQQPFQFDQAGNLLVPGVHSPNYTPGVQGWTINQDGSAEFNNVVIRGGTVISGVSLYYNGTPAAGNLIASIAAAAGTDPFGNGYLAGVSTYDNTDHTFTQMVDGTINLGNIVSGVPDITQSTQMFSSIGTFEILGPRDHDASFDDRPRVFLTAGDTGMSEPNGLNEPMIGLKDSLGNSVMSQQISGANVHTQIDGTPDTWQAPSYNANWSGSTTFNGLTGLEALSYRLDTEDDIVFHGGFKASSTTLPGTAVFNISDTRYRPVTQGVIFTLRNNGGTITSGYSLYTSGGNFDVFGQFNMGIALGNEYYSSGTLRLRNLR